MATQGVLGAATLKEFEDGLHGETGPARRWRLRRGALDLERRPRRPPGGDRPLRRRLRRAPRGRLRPQRGAGRRRARRQPQHSRLLDRRGRDRHRPLADEGHQGRRGRPPPPRRGGRHLGRARRRHPGARPRHHRRPGLDHRRRRLHPGRRDRLADAQARPRLRQPALGRGGHRRRPDPHRERDRERRPLLGPARGRRQLRRRHLLRVRPAPGRPDRGRRPGLLPGRPGRGGPALLPRVRARPPRRADAPWSTCSPRRPPRSCPRSGTARSWSAWSAATPATPRRG